MLGNLLERKAFLDYFVDKFIVFVADCLGRAPWHLGIGFPGSGCNGRKERLWNMANKGSDIKLVHQEMGE